MRDRQNADVCPQHESGLDAGLNINIGGGLAAQSSRPAPNHPNAPTTWGSRVVGAMGLDFEDEETSPECAPFHRTPAHACSDFTVSAHGEVLTLGEPVGEPVMP